MLAREVSSFCLGAMMFGASGNTDHDESIEIIHGALDGGISFIGTADVDGAGESEEIFGQAEEKGPLTEAAYVEALEKNHRLARAKGIDHVMDEHRLDALFAPTTSPPWTIDLVNGDHGLGGCSTPAAVAGYPHVTVPAGYAFGLPVGVSFFGRAWSEPVLIRLAYAFEQAMKARRPPRFAATAELVTP